MTQQAELLKKIDKIPQKYLGEVIDFLGYLQHKAQQESQPEQCAPQKQFANNIEFEQNECTVRFATDSNGKLLLTKELIEEMLQKSPYTRSLSGILSGMEDVDLDKVRMERLAKHL